jgi:predicted LPLAT superfamily acyltransferase/GT2 family glycosyltransferase
MNFSACAIIPIYNHGETIAAVVGAVQAQGLKCFVIDDGSDETTQASLRQLIQIYPNLTLLRLPENQGKGVAVTTGFKAAYAAGFTHGLQIDADGQHAFDDVDELVTLGKQYPNELISGLPIYDDSIPKARLYGRYVTHFWVWIETLSFQIKDSMCGFRLYPLAACCELMDKTHIGTHMDFDTEMMVKLYWQGVSVKFLPTKVIYPQDGISHFRALQDNIAISKMHVRLFWGMLWRSPMLLWRKCFSKQSSLVQKKQIKNQHWSKQQERGHHLGLAFTLKAYKLLGPSVFRIMLYPIIGYFFITGRAARRYSQQFLNRVYQFDNQSLTKKPGLMDSFSHFMSFGRAGVDKLSSWMGDVKPETVCFDKRQVFDGLVAEKKGAVFIGSHLGNLELGRALSKYESNLVINAIVFSDNAQKFSDQLKQTNPEYDVNLIQISTLGPDMAMRLKSKVEQGEILVIVGDRTSTSVAGRVSYASFLGEVAPFPQGPFIIASLMECSVYLMFCMQDGDNYKLYFESFADQGIRLPRKQREQVLQQVIERYALRLQYYALKYPFQWFNFFDFWNSDNVKRTSDARSLSSSE